MPEGDTIALAAARIRPVLEGVVPDSVATPQRRHARDRWPARLEGRKVNAVRTHGKHLFLDFEGDLTIHSHLRMTGAWSVTQPQAKTRRSRNRAWLIIRASGQEVINFDGPVLELMTKSRSRSARHLAQLGPDVLAEQFDSQKFLRRLREDDPTRGFGDALLDQQTIAGIGNIWKAETCWGAGIDPWRAIGDIADSEALNAIELVRPRMMASAAGHERDIKRGVYARGGRECTRCGERIKSRGQGDDNRITWWCPGCQL